MFSSSVTTANFWHNDLREKFCFISQFKKSRPCSTGPVAFGTVVRDSIRTRSKTIQLMSSKQKRAGKDWIPTLPQEDLQLASTPSTFHNFPTMSQVELQSFYPWISQIETVTVYFHWKAATKKKRIATRSVTWEMRNL